MANENTVSRTAKAELEALGMKTTRTPDDYRRVLQRNGVAVKVSDYTATMIGFASEEMEKAGKAGQRAAYALGQMSLSGQWAAERDSAGKNFRSESAFFRAVMPRFAYTTLANYAGVGKHIYIPIKNGDTTFAGLEWLANVNPGNLKFLLGCIKDPDTMPYMLDELRKFKSQEKTPQKDYTEAVKNAKIAAGKTTPRLPDGNKRDDDNGEPDAPETTSDNPDLSPEDVTANMVNIMEQFFRGTTEDDEITLLVPEQARETLFATLADCAGNATSATAFCAAFCEFLKSVK